MRRARFEDLDGTWLGESAVDEPPPQTLERHWSVGCLAMPMHFRLVSSAPLIYRATDRLNEGTEAP